MTRHEPGRTEPRNGAETQRDHGHAAEVRHDLVEARHPGHVGRAQPLDLCRNLDGVQTVPGVAKNGKPRIVALNKRGHVVCVTAAWLKRYGMKPVTRTVKTSSTVTKVIVRKCKCPKPAVKVCPAPGVRSNGVEGLG